MWDRQSIGDLAIIAGLSVMVAVVALAFRIPERLPVSEIVPYGLLWLTLCFSIFIYRRWHLVMECGDRHQPGIGNWTWDIAQDRRQWCDEIYAIFGIPEDSPGPTYHDYLVLVHPEDRQLYEQTVSRSLRDNVGYDIDYRICTPGGEVRIVREKCAVQFNQGRAIKMTGTLTDVTERKHAEADLKGRYDLLQSLIDAIPIPVYHKDENGLYEGCNKSFEDFNGTTKEQILGKSVHDFMPSELAMAQENMDKALFRQGGIQTYEAKIGSANGTHVDVIYHKAVRIKKDGSVGGLVGTILDISDRKRMEIALKDSEQRFKNIAESASDWFWETDNKHRLSYLSDRVKDILGVSPETILGKTRMELVGKQQFAQDLEKWQHHQDDLAHHRSFKDLVYVFTPSGAGEHHISINGVPVFDDDGKFRGYRGTGADITKNILVEGALRESEERHRNFAADVAHELRTPLAVLQTHLDNLDDSKEVLSLRQDVGNMTRLVAQLLAMTRIETYTTDETMSDVNLGEVCRNVATHIAPLAIKEHRSIEVIGGNEPVLVKGNSASLEQAVRNLVENAIRYSARGTVITLKINGNDVPSIMVIDRGRGVAPEQREKIFMRFKRSDRRGGGAGLGLSIVKRTIKNHNGRIEIKDTPDGGATFVLLFPPISDAVQTKTIIDNNTL